MIFFIVLQLRYLLPAIPSNPNRMGAFLCVAGYATLRVTTRTIALLLACPRVGGLDYITFCFIKEYVVRAAKTGLATGLTLAGRKERNSFRIAVISRWFDGPRGKWSIACKRNVLCDLCVV
jgi:hypothetical protein